MPGFGKRIDVPGGRRRAPRQRIAITATAVGLEGVQSVVVDEVSSTGAKLRGTNLPECGREMFIKVGDVDVFASVAWSSAEQCGISFDPPVDQHTVVRLRHEGRLAVTRVV